MFRALVDRQVRMPFAYGAAIALVGGSAALLQQLNPTWGSDVVWLAFIIAVLATGTIGGFGPALFAAVLSLLAADYLFLPTPGTFKLPYDAHDVIALMIFVSASLLAATVSHVGRRALVQQARADAAGGQVAAARLRRNLLLELGSRALAGGSADAVSREATTMITAALGVEHAAILQRTRDTGPLLITAAAGWDAGVVDGLTIDADVDSQAGYAIYAREPVVVDDGDSDTRFRLPDALRARGVRSGIAARIAGAGRPHGVVIAYSTSPRAYTPEDAQFVCGVAAVLAGCYEQKRLEAECAQSAARDVAHRNAAEVASRRAAFLAQTVTVFDAALEPEVTLVSLARLAVPALADCAIVDLVHDDGQVRRVEVIDIDPSRRDAVKVARRMTPDLHSESPFARAIRTGQPVLLADIPDRDVDSGADLDHERLVKLLQCRSLLLIPLVARGQTLGLITLASRPSGRRYEALDLGVAQELAGRAA